MIKGLYNFAKKWSEKGSVWIISDTHFDDEDRDIMGYAITEKEQHDILKNRICKNDTLIHLGDIGNPEYLADIPGYKVLILGNHDWSASKYQPYFDEIYEGPLTISRKIILSHEPVDVLWAFNIHGHDHTPDHYGDDHHLNLAANVCGYTPVSLGKLIKDGVMSKVEDIHRVTVNKTTERCEKKMYRIVAVRHSGRKGTRGERVESSKYDGVTDSIIRTNDLSKVQYLDKLTWTFIQTKSPHDWWETSEILSAYIFCGDYILETVNTIYVLRELANE